MREFTSVSKKETVKVDGVDYEIRELTQAARSAYLKELSSTMKVRMVGTGEKDAQNNEVMRKEIDILDLSGGQVALLKATLFSIDEDGKARSIEKSVLMNWRSGLVEGLAAIASELNGLERPEDLLEKEAEKN